MKDTNERDEENPFNKLSFPSRKTKALSQINLDKASQNEFLQRKRSDVNKIFDNHIFSSMEETLIDHNEKDSNHVNNPIDIIRNYEKNNNKDMFKQSFHHIVKRIDSFTSYPENDPSKSSLFEEGMRDGLILLTYIMGSDSD